MIELRNRQYAYIVDCVAGENLEVGQVVTLTHHEGRDLITAEKAAASGDVVDVVGPLFAHWINDRSTAVAFSGGEDGLTFPLAPSSDEDANHYIPSGKRMLAVGGKGFAEIRFFPESLHDPNNLPDPATVLQFNGTTAKLQVAGGSGVVNKNVALVLENDGVSISVVVG